MSIEYGKYPIVEGQESAKGPEQPPHAPDKSIQQSHSGSGNDRYRTLGSAATQPANIAALRRYAGLPKAQDVRPLGLGR